MPACVSNRLARPRKSRFGAGDRPDAGVRRGKRSAQVLVGQEVVAAAQQKVTVLSRDGGVALVQGLRAGCQRRADVAGGVSAHVGHARTAGLKAPASRVPEEQHHQHEGNRGHSASLTTDDYTMTGNQTADWDG